MSPVTAHDLYIKKIEKTVRDFLTRGVLLTARQTEADGRTQTVIFKRPFIGRAATPALLYASSISNRESPSQLPQHPFANELS